MAEGWALTLNLQNDFPERIVPDQVHDGAYANHLKRYEFARQFAAGQRVLDVACGVGYGSAHLSDTARSVVGVDIDYDAVMYATKHYRHLNVAFSQTDALKLPFQANIFDVVCSFETIEHVPHVEQYLEEVRRVLELDGLYLVSTPAASVSTLSPANPHHVQEWSPADFEALLRRYFSHVDLYSQHILKQKATDALKTADHLNLRLLIPKPLRLLIARTLGLRTMYDIKLQHIAITPGIHPEASEIIALCR